MAKIYPQVEGKIFRGHDAFLKKLTERGAKIVNSRQDSDATILFCPIVTRYEVDLNTALSKLPEIGRQKLILVVMHHTQDPDYTAPSSSDLSRPVDLKVDCLFHEEKGLLVCSKNETAIESVLQEVDPKRSAGRPWWTNLCDIF